MSLDSAVNAGSGVAPDATSLLDLLENAARGRGTVQFVGDDPEPSSIGALWGAADVSARWIASHAGAGEAVAMVLTNTRPCVTSLFGAWRAGCTVASLPLPARGMAPARYVEQLERFCAAAGATTLLVDPAHVGMLDGTALTVHAYDDAMRGGPTRPVGGEGALVQFTSGSVGTPKGIHLTLDAVGTHVAAIVAALEPVAGDGSCSWLPLSHDMGLIGQLLSPLAAGAPEYGHHRLTLMKPESFMANPRSWLRTCSETASTVTVAPNFALDLAVRTSRNVEHLDLSPVRSIIVGSEAVRAETLERFAATFAPAGLRSLALCPAYGLAEATLAVTIVRPHEHWRAIPRPSGATGGEGRDRPLVSTGRPVDRTDVRVAAPDGEVGPIEFRSPSLLSRYIGAELTFTDDGFFVTGDNGVMHDGELFVVGRSDEAIVVAGRNIYPDDVETTVQHSLVRDGCVAAVVAPDGGLAIVVEASGRASSAELEVACREIRTMVTRETGTSPSVVAFVPRRALPKTPSGKLRRVEVARSLAAGDGFVTRVDFT
ncbi:MAG TPA: AMP-binding protein [Acidimicrobiia bacterium]|nr:AMP-binding protein [Acidimicrobiia bacterium]